jgi:lipoprotein-anchoring transpeptidase ErfK/SrfK
MAASAIRSARGRSICSRDRKDTRYRIHGTTEPDGIGKAVSSGCIRMMNQDVIDLYGRVPLGAKVVVL